jgi:outer membrane protein, heavy metal efflux system
MLRTANVLGRALSAAAASALIASSPCPARADGPKPSASTVTPFVPSADLDLATLEKIVRKRSAAVQSAALDVDVAAAEVRQSRLLPNPVLDGSWGTIPVGETNPRNLASPLANVPNYNVGISYTFLLGKRGPREVRALAAQRGATAVLDATSRTLALSFAKLLGQLATSTLRREGVRGLVEASRRSVTLAESRLDASFATPIDVDRLRIDLHRAEQTLVSVDSDISAALADCAALAGAPCQGFSGSAEARELLDRWIRRASTTAHAGKLEDRADIRALGAYREAAAAEASLARAQAIPDPTVRFGYTHDRFIAAGNQRNSLNVSLSLPLPIFDHGQAAAQAAEAKKARLGEQRARALGAAEARIPALARRVVAQRKRQETLAKEILPRALNALRDVERAAENRLLPLTDVIQARRAVDELLVEEADSYRDAFDATVELMAEEPPPPSSQEPKK